MKLDQINELIDYLDQYQHSKNHDQLNFALNKTIDKLKEYAGECAIRDMNPHIMTISKEEFEKLDFKVQEK